jgi:hemerythrin
MARFEWTERYAIGNKDIDDQHKVLIELANILSSAVNAGEATSILWDAFDTLLLYVGKHFSEEETLFEDMGCTLLGAHREEHETLEGELRLLWNNERNGLIHDAGRQLEQWVEQRLVPHMIEVDQEALKSATRVAGSGG